MHKNAILTLIYKQHHTVQFIDYMKFFSHTYTRYDKKQKNLSTLDFSSNIPLPSPKPAPCIPNVTSEPQISLTIKFLMRVVNWKVEFTPLKKNFTGEAQLK